MKQVEKKLLEYWDGTALFITKDVINIIISNQYNLPEDRSQVPDALKVYARIVDVANKQVNHPVYCDIFRKGFYAFPPALFNEIAEIFQMKATQFAQYLKRHGYLYLQDSSEGLQSYVNIFGCNCYCVRTLKEYQREVTPLESPEELFKKL